MNWPEISLDPYYPFVAYAYLVVLAFFIKFLMVVHPLLKLHNKYSKPGRILRIYQKIDPRRVKDSLKEILSDSQQRKLKRFLSIELILLVTPALVAIILRLILGEPEKVSWNSFQLVIGVGIGFLWLTLHFWQALLLRDLIKPLEYYFDNPVKMRSTLSAAIITRDGLKKLSELEPEKLERNPEEIMPLENVITTDDDGKISGLDGGAIKGNISEIWKKTYTGLYNATVSAKLAVKSTSKRGLDLYEGKIQSKIDEFTGIKFSTKLRDYTFDLIMVLSPLFIIYLILPLLE